MRQLTELDVYILKQEFPQLSLTEDPDIERYFEFRSLNRQGEALQLYNTKLVRRYPDDKMRVLLMTYYRKRDYRFHILLTDSLAKLADRTIVQVKKSLMLFRRIVLPLSALPKNMSVMLKGSSIMQPICTKLPILSVCILPTRFLRYGNTVRNKAGKTI